MRCYFSGHFLRLPVGPGDTQASGEASETPLHDQSGFDGFLLFLASLNTHNDHSALSTCVLCPHWAHFTRCLIQIKSTLCFLRIHKNVLRYFTWASLTSLMLYNVNQLRVSCHQERAHVQSSKHLGVVSRCWNRKTEKPRIPQPCFAHTFYRELLTRWSGLCIWSSWSLGSTTCNMPTE